MQAFQLGLEHDQVARLGQPLAGRSDWHAGSLPAWPGWYRYAGIAPTARPEVRILDRLAAGEAINLILHLVHTLGDGMDRVLVSGSIQFAINLGQLNVKMRAGGRKTRQKGRWRQAFGRRKGASQETYNGLRNASGSQQEALSRSQEVKS